MASLTFLPSHPTSFAPFAKQTVSLAPHNCSFITATLAWNPTWLPEFSSGFSHCKLGDLGCAQLGFGPRPSVAECVRSRSGYAATVESNVAEMEDVETLQRIIQESGDKMVVINISTKTCGPCKLIYPKFVKMSLEYPNAVFLKVNGDLNKDTRALMKKWDVRAVPSFKFFRNGNLIHSHTGAKEDELRSYFMAYYMASAES
eukprot:c19135_g1_i1 orf=253-858(+)